MDDIKKVLQMAPAANQDSPEPLLRDDQIMEILGVTYSDYHTPNKSGGKKKRNKTQKKRRGQKKKQGKKKAKKTSKKNKRYTRSGGQKKSRGQRKSRKR